MPLGFAISARAELPRSLTGDAVLAGLDAGKNVSGAETVASAVIAIYSLILDAELAADYMSIGVPFAD